MWETQTNALTDLRLKGLVLAGGKGSRLRPLTATGAKQLVPVAKKQVLFFALEQLVAVGIDEIGIIASDAAAQVEAAVGGGSAYSARYLPPPIRTAQTGPCGYHRS
jgi:glucose-1-phosphate thymidylyltransferase